MNKVDMSSMMKIIDGFLEEMKDKDIDANIMYLDNQFHKLSKEITESAIRDKLSNESKQILVNLYEQFIQLFKDFKAEHMNK